MRNALVLFVIAAGSCGLSGCQTVYNILAPTFAVLSFFSGDDYDDESSFDDDYGPSSEEIRQHRRELAEMRETDQ
jgi:hypothetical protein